MLPSEMLTTKTALHNEWDLGIENITVDDRQFLSQWNLLLEYCNKID